MPHRFAFNDTNEGYTGAYRGWDAWEREIDVLALHGINEVFVYTGADAAILPFREFGYSDAELRAWIPAPAHQPWWLLQNCRASAGRSPGGSSTRAPPSAAKIADRVRELGMTPVLPGYFGTVPDDFAEHGRGRGRSRRAPGSASNAPTGSTRARTSSPGRRRLLPGAGRAFGDSDLYKMDLLHEGGNPGDVPVAEAASRRGGAPEGPPRCDLGHPRLAVQPARAHPRRRRQEHMLIVDGLSDRYTTVTDRETDWGGTPYAFGTIWNFGGHTPMGANAPDWVEQYPKWRDKEGSALAGSR